MKKVIFIISILTVLYSCEKTSEEPVVEVDFSFGYSEGKFTANDGSSNVPEGSSYTWVLNGKEKGSSQNLISSIDSDGHYAISLCIETPNGIESCKAEEFQISNEILVPYDYVDTAQIAGEKGPVIDFSFGYSAGTVTANNGSSNVPEGSSYTWVLDGVKASSSQNLTSNIYGDGHYAISLCIEMPNGIESCKAKDFQILDDMLVPYDYIDTTKNSAEKEPVIDFSFGYSAGTVTANDGSSNVPEGSSYTWILNGKEKVSSQNLISSIDSDGHYAISLCIETPNGIESCKAKEFQIANEILVPYDYVDTIKNMAKKEPVINFSYSVLYKSDSTEVEIGMSNASTTHYDGSHSYSWYLNGEYLGPHGTSHSVLENRNGHYSITLVVEFDGLSYSASKEFEVTGIKD